MTDTEPLTELMGLINSNSNPKDAAFKVMSENIWKPEMLKQMGRFDKSQINDLIKNYIVILLYEKRWSEIKVTHQIITTKQYPFYRVKTISEYNPIDTEKFLKESGHNRILEIVTELYIGESGKARDEVFGFITSYAKAMEEARLQHPQIPQ